MFFYVWFSTSTVDSARASRPLQALRTDPFGPDPARNTLITNPPGSRPRRLHAALRSDGYLYVSLATAMSTTATFGQSPAHRPVSSA